MAFGALFTASAAMAQTAATQPTTTASGATDTAVTQPSNSGFKSQDAAGDTDDLTHLSLEDLMNVQVSTVSRVDEPTDKAPGNVYVYQRDVIQDRGYRSLGELLQTVPGFFVTHKDLDYVVDVRGLLANDNDKVSLLVNGQNINGPQEQDFLNGPINLDNVERVEVVVGPSSLFQPANTLAATVNVITKQTEGFEVISGVGNYLKYSETVMAGHRFNKDEAINLSFTTESEKGFDGFGPQIELGQPDAHEVGAENWPSYFGILNGQYGEVTGQFIAYNNDWPELHIDGGSPLNNGQMTEEKYSFYLKAEHPFSSTLTGVAWAEATQKGQTRLNNDGPAINSVQQSVKQWDFSSELGLRYTGIQNNLIQTGVQSEYDLNYDTWFTYLAPGQTGFIPQTTLLNQNDYDLGFYADDEFTLNDQWKLVGGARVDHNTKIPGDQWFPGARAAIIYSPTKNWTSKVVYTRAVHMPSALDALNSVWGSEHASNPADPTFAQISGNATEPEILSTIEWDNVVYVHNVRLGANIYHQELQDFITWFQPQSNGGNLRGNGVELNMQAPLGADLDLWANAAWNDSKLDLFNNALFGPNPTTGGTEGLHAYTNEQGRIIGSPEYTANVGVDYKISRHLSISPAVRYFTNQAAAVDFTRDETIRNRYYVDATITWKHLFDRDLDLRVSGTNLLNNRQPVATALAGDTYKPEGIGFVVSLDYRF